MWVVSSFKNLLAHQDFVLDCKCFLKYQQKYDKFIQPPVSSNKVFPPTLLKQIIPPVGRLVPLIEHLSKLPPSPPTYLRIKNSLSMYRFLNIKP